MINMENIKEFIRIGHRLGKKTYKFRNRYTIINKNCEYIPVFNILVDLLNNYYIPSEQTEEMHIFNYLFYLFGSPNIQRNNFQENIFNDLLQQKDYKIQEMLRAVNSSSYIKEFHFLSCSSFGIKFVLMVKKEYVPFVISEIIVNQSLDNVMKISEFWFNGDANNDHQLRNLLSSFRFKKCKIVCKENLNEELLSYPKLPKFSEIEEFETFKSKIVSEWVNKSKEGSFF